MVFEVKKRVMDALRVLRDDRLRLHVGAVLVVGGLALFGMYYPKAAQAPHVQSHTSQPAGQAQVAGANAGATYNPTAEPTHAGAPETGQHMAEIPGADPEKCRSGTAAGKTSAPTGLQGTIDVTIPAGCTSDTYELRTADGHAVTWAPLFGAFTYADGTSFNERGDTAMAVINLPFNKEGHTGAGITYTVSARTTAAGETYEHALYVTDPSHTDGGYKVVLRVTVK